MSYAHHFVMDASTHQITQRPLDEQEIAARDQERAAAVAETAAREAAEQERAEDIATIQSLLAGSPNQAQLNQALRLFLKHAAK